MVIQGKGLYMEQTARQKLIGEAFRADGVASSKIVDQHVKGLTTQNELFFRLSDVLVEALMCDNTFKVSNNVLREISKAYDAYLQVPA